MHKVYNRRLTDRQRKGIDILKTPKGKQSNTGEQTGKRQ